MCKKKKKKKLTHMDVELMFRSNLKVFLKNFTMIMFCVENLEILTCISSSPPLVDIVYFDSLRIVVNLRI